MKKNLSKEEKEMKDNLIDESFYRIHGWMLNELKLKGNELVVYALIYSFTQSGVGEFVGTQKYLMYYTGIQSTQTIYKTLKKLIAKGYITERSSNSEHGKANVYQAKTLQEIFGENGNLRTYSPTFAKKHSVCKEKEKISATTIKQDDVVSSEKEALFFATDKGYAKITDGVPKKCGRGYLKNAYPYNKEYNDNYYKIDYNIRKKENKGIKIGERNFEKEEKIYPRESYSQLMDKYNLSKELKKNMFKLIQHCNLNGKIMTNDKLERLITFLLEKPEKERNTLILTAIDKGYFDVFRGTEKSVNESSSARFENERKYTQEYFDSLITNISDIKI